MNDDGGTAGGIGRAIVEALLQQGFIVFGTVLTDKEVETVKAYGDANLHIVRCDITSEGDIEVRASWTRRRSQLFSHPLQSLLAAPQTAGGGCQCASDRPFQQLWRFRRNATT